MPVLFLIVVIDLIGFGMIIPLLPFFAEHFNATPAQVGFLMAIYSVTQFISAPLWGYLSDKYGRKPILIGTMIGAAFGYVWLGFAETLVALFAARAFGGLMAGNIATAFAYAADVTSKEDRAKGMGLMGAAFSIGFILGPAFGGILAGADPMNADYQTPSFVAAALSATAFLSGLIFLKESLPAETRAKARSAERTGRLAALTECLKAPGIGIFFLFSFLSVFVFAGLEATFAMWSRRQFGWGPEQNGYLFAFIGVITAIVQGGLIGRLSRRFGVENLIAAGSLLLALGLAAIPFSATVPMLMGAMLVAGVGFGIVSPALNTAISLRGADETQGRLMGATRSVTTMSRITGPAIAGMIFASFGLHSPYVLGAVIMFGVAAAAFFLRPQAPSKRMDTKA